MVDITFILPWADYHAPLLDRAIASVKAQTIPCAVIPIEDTERRGPGWARNQGLAQVVTPYVAFLDADDTIAPNFAQVTLTAIQQRPNRYVYTDWWESGQQVKQAPACAWTTPKSEEPKDNTSHLITALIRTEDAVRVGGFDETLAFMEDADFYIKLVFDAGVCGVRVPLPLVYYQPDGGNQRSKLRDVHAINTLTRNTIIERSKGKVTMCCGGEKIEMPEDIDMNNLPPDYVMARTLWNGYRRETGRVTGIMYPSSGWGDLLPVHKLDLELMKDKFELVGRSERQSLPDPQPEPAHLARVDVQTFTDPRALFKALTGAVDPPPPVYDPYAGQTTAAGKMRDMGKLMGKLQEMLG